METSARQPEYTAYLLRCWQEGMVWRYSLEEVGSGQRRGFASLELMASFLRNKEGPAGNERPIPRPRKPAA